MLLGLVHFLLTSTNALRPAHTFVWSLLLPTPSGGAADPTPWLWLPLFELTRAALTPWRQPIGASAPLGPRRLFFLQPKRVRPVGNALVHFYERPLFPRGGPRQIP